MEKKVCSKCKEEKEVCEFYKDSTRKDGYDHTCKSCYKQKRQSINLNKEKRRERDKKYYSNNIGKIRVYQKKYQCKTNAKIITLTYLLNIGINEVSNKKN